MIDIILTWAHVFICIFLVGIVLLQQGKGADMGATFGGGGNTLFGASGADNLLTKVTTILAIFFMLTSVGLATRGKREFIESGNLFQDVDVESSELPAAEQLPEDKSTEELPTTSIDTSTEEVEVDQNVEAKDTTVTNSPAEQIDQTMPSDATSTQAVEAGTTAAIPLENNPPAEAGDQPTTAARIKDKATP